jgi:hypothetical protein
MIVPRTLRRSLVAFGVAVLSLASLHHCYAENAHDAPLADRAAPSSAPIGTSTTIAPIPGTAIPVIKGFNFSLNSSSQHSSVTGWSNTITPDLSFRFTRHIWVDSNFPWVLSIKNFVPVTKGTVTTYPLQTTNDTLGDTSLNGHFDADRGNFTSNGTATVAFNTGNYLYGLSANTTTYNFVNQFNYAIGPFTPDVQIGEGNSSSLANTTTNKSYTAVGALANFQAGSTLDLPWNFLFDLEAYENLPIGTQKIYGTITTKVKGKNVSEQVLEGAGIAEDNGFFSELDIPLAAHFILSGQYQRSLRQGSDTAAIGLTYFLRVFKTPSTAK